jgi:hypothetical protein
VDDGGQGGADAASLHALLHNDGLQGGRQTDSKHREAVGRRVRVESRWAGGRASGHASEQGKAGGQDVQAGCK